MESKKENKCKLCEEEIEGLGNNPYPLLTDEGSRVCDTCDNFVTTVRIFDIQQMPQWIQYNKIVEWVLKEMPIGDYQRIVRGDTPRSLNSREGRILTNLYVYCDFPMTKEQQENRDKRELRKSIVEEHEVTNNG